MKRRKLEFAEETDSYDARIRELKAETAFVNAKEQSHLETIRRLRRDVAAKKQAFEASKEVQELEKLQKVSRNSVQEGIGSFFQ
jgi:hypothetical protein